MDPAELRRKNYLAAADLPYEIDLPYRDGNPLVYDSGDFRAGLEAALGAVDYEALRREQAELRARGIHRGIGLSGYVEGTAIGPYEGATVRMDASGRAVVATGAASQGQGQETSFAQVAADVPRDPDRVGDGDRRRHRGDPVRHRDVREPERGERGQLHPRRIGPGAGQARGRGGGAPGGGARTTSRSPTAWPRCAGRRPPRCRSAG